MAGIERVGLGRTTAIRAWGGIRPSLGFSIPTDNPRPDTIAAPIALGGLLGLQEQKSDEEAPARQEANALLAELAALQRTLLGGGDPSAVLQRLDSMLGSSPDTASQPLLAVLSAVRMRARVELAKRSGGEKQ
jgi:hypothetical protein